MCPGISDDLQQVNDSRKTVIIDRELTRLDVSIAAVQETTLASSGCLKEEKWERVRGTPLVRGWFFSQ